MKIGFAVMPEESLTAQVVETENRYHDDFGFFDKLGFHSNIPHITLFQGSFEDTLDYGKVIREASREADKRKLSKVLAFQQVDYVPQGWYFWECEKTESLVFLHYFILQACIPYVILPFDRMDEDMSFLTQEQIRGIERYNYRYSEEAFKPHVTVGRTKGKDENILETLNEKLLPQTVRADQIAVYEMGDNGTCKSIADSITI